MWLENRWHSLTWHNRSFYAHGRQALEYKRVLLDVDCIAVCMCSVLYQCLATQRFYVHLKRKYWNANTRIYTCSLIYPEIKSCTAMYPSRSNFPPDQSVKCVSNSNTCILHTYPDVHSDFRTLFQSSRNTVQFSCRNEKTNIYLLTFWFYCF